MADASDKRVRSIDDLKPYYPRILKKPRHVNITVADLPVTGDSHDWNTIDETEEEEIKEILERRKVHKKTSPNKYG